MSEDYIIIDENGNVQNLGTAADPDFMEPRDPERFRYQCPNCRKLYKAVYKDGSGGAALANFNRHVESCEGEE